MQNLEVSILSYLLKRYLEALEHVFENRTPARFVWLSCKYLNWVHKLPCCLAPRTNHKTVVQSIPKGNKTYSLQKMEANKEFQYSSGIGGAHLMPLFISLHNAWYRYIYIYIYLFICPYQKCKRTNVLKEQDRAH